MGEKRTVGGVGVKGEGGPGELELPEQLPAENFPPF